MRTRLAAAECAGFLVRGIVSSSCYRGLARRIAPETKDESYAARVILATMVDVRVEFHGGRCDA
jgi:hypothetical protein